MYAPPASDLTSPFGKSQAPKNRGLRQPASRPDVLPHSSQRLPVLDFPSYGRKRHFLQPLYYIFIIKNERACADIRNDPCYFQPEAERNAAGRWEPARLFDTIAMRVLLVEDDKAVASFVKKGLEAEHYAVDVAVEGEEGRFMAEAVDYDLVILDLNLPTIDGIEVLQRIRARRATLPVLVLTARNRVEDRVRGLDQGADDYLVKPFSFSELSARLRALSRRAARPNEVVLHVADLEMNRAERTVRRAGGGIDLTPKEFTLLEYLMRNAGRCVTRAMIIEHVWNFSFDTMTNVVDVYINYLRKKVDEGFKTRLIHTVRGVGYQMGEKE